MNAQTSPTPHAHNEIIRQTVICTDKNHCHGDPHINIIRLTVYGHRVIVESEQWSRLFSVWIDGVSAGVLIPSAQLDEIIERIQL